MPRLPRLDLLKGICMASNFELFFDSRTRRMLLGAASLVETGSHALAYVDLSGTNDKTGAIRTAILNRQGWLNYQDLFLHSSGGSLRIRHGRNIAENWKQWVETYSDDEARAPFIDPVLIETGFKPLLTHLRVWDADRASSVDEQAKAG